jgi:hypothetical protein
MKSIGIITALLALVLTLVACGARPQFPEKDQAASESNRATVLLPGQDKPLTVSYEVMDGYAIFEGDIILGKADELEKGGLESQGIAVENRSYLWPGGIVPYSILSNVTSTGRTNIANAIAHFEARTNLNFVERTSSNASLHPDYIQFGKGSSSNSCSSSVGRQTGMQMLFLRSDGSCSVGSLIHELGHAVGLYHEQSREDRDNHVKILWENIQMGQEDNFQKYVSESYDMGAYDYASIMHYGETFFSKNGEPTIETIPAGIDIGQRTGLSTGDIAALNKLYPSTTMSYGLSKSDVQKQVAQFAVNNRKLTELNAYVDNTGQVRYITKWGRTLSQSWNWFASYDLTQSQLTSLMNSNTSQGWYISHLDVYTVNGTPYFTAIWEEKAVLSEYKVHYDLTSSQMQSLLSSYPAQDYKAKTISGYTVNGEARYAAIWQKTNVYTIAKHDLTLNNFTTHDFLYSHDWGYKLIHLDTYKVGSSIRYAAVWLKSSSFLVKRELFMDASELNTKSNINGNLGYTLTEVAVVPNSNGVNYSAVWSKNLLDLNLP